MNLRYLRKLRPILNKVGKKHNIPIEEGEFIISNFFKSFRNALSDPRVPRVKLPLFGTFQPNIPYIYKSLKGSFRFYRKGAISRTYMAAKTKRLWLIRNRLLKESKGIDTWKEWKRKDKLEELNKMYINEQEEKRRSSKKVYWSGDNPKKPSDVLSAIQKGLLKKD